MKRSVDKIVYYNELFVLVSIFFGLLYFLFPSKERLEQMILQEDRNFDLAQRYLETTLQIDPQNVRLMIALAKRYIQDREYDKAQQVLRKLLPYKQELALVYDLLFELAEAKKDEALMERLVKEVARSSFSLAIAKRWFARALWLHDTSSAYIFVKYIFEHEPTVHWAQEYYVLALAMKDIKGMRAALQVAIRSKELRWMQEYFYFLMRQGEDEAALEVARAIYKKWPDKRWIRTMAQLYERLHNPSRAYTLWKRLLEDPKYAKEAFEHMVALRAAQKKDVISFIFAHRRLWEADVAMIKRMIRTLLGQGRRKEAEKLGDILLREGL